jgi:hypothetical protein
MTITSELVFLQILVEITEIFQEDLQIHTVVVRRCCATTGSWYPATLNLTAMCSGVSYDHILWLDIFVLMPSVFHTALNDFDECATGLDRVSTWADSTSTVTDHTWSTSLALLVTASHTIWDCSGFAPDICTIAIDLENLVEEIYRISSGAVLDSA